MTARKLAVVLGVMVLAVVGGAAALAFFNARDDATVARGDGPGRPRPPGTDPPVRAGNVVLLHERPALEAPLQALAADIAGEPTPALQAAGQAVLVRRAANLGPDVRAITATRQIDAVGADDPQLRAFVEHWLGRAPE